MQSINQGNNIMTNLGEKPHTKKEEALQSLPRDLWPAYEELIADYQYLCKARLGRSFVNYAILADLIAYGWRRTGKSVQLELST
jgi:hypothetical protein